MSQRFLRWCDGAGLEACFNCARFIETHSRIEFANLRLIPNASDGHCHDFIAEEANAKNPTESTQG